MQNNIYTVKQVNSYLKRMFEDDFILHEISVEGEVSNLTYHRSGHIYFSLKDASGVLSAVMFASNAIKLRIRLKEGMQVVARGSISVYEAGGRYQLYAKSIEEAGQGDLFRQFEELKARLEESGMFSEQYKKPIPAFGMHIGVVTAETGAVIRDIYNVSSRRNPYCQITLYPSLVQGPDAPPEIVKGIETLDGMGLDCIIVGRGGGSMEDLWCFNDERVAMAIFNARTPIISAVGHETDFTIADFVADLRAPTPSAAAELAVFDYNRFMEDIISRDNFLRNSMDRALRTATQKKDYYALKIDRLKPENLLLKKKHYLADLADSIEKVMDLKLRAGKEKLAQSAERLSGLSPLKRLSEGYAFAADTSGKAVKSISDVETGDVIEVNVLDGYLRSRVEQKVKVDHE